MDGVAVLIDGEERARGALESSPGIAKHYPHVATAKRSSFELEAPVETGELEDFVDLRLLGLAGGVPKAKIETWFRPDQYDLLPTPPLEYRMRVIGNKRPVQFFISGIQTFREYWTGLSRHADVTTVKRLLEWGCGCGRLTGWLAREPGIGSVHGCDVDPEMIRWCRENLPSADFSTIPTYPPTSFAEGSFDAILSYSVFTHLLEEVQQAWLRELHRVLAPGGLFLTSVHGDFAIWCTFPAKRARAIMESGFDDSLVDGSLDGILPEGYYRATFQTRDYTETHWRSYFEILEYLEGGAFNHQDLIVMRRRDHPREPFDLDRR